ncbi:sensor histidine kinase [Bariatricus sp. SGI.154]|uniref:sensor histidine kinase n=1 Tax=Bariatricus sp. SGI.154 TaxID=3420549 RepID=UPI003D00EA74
MRKNLSKSQKFDIIMGALMLVDFFLPWINCGEYRCSVAGYLFECLKTGNYVDSYRKLILVEIENILPKLENAALWFVAVCIFIVMIHILGMIYAFVAMKGRCFTRIPMMGAVVMLAFVIMTFHDIWMEESDAYYALYTAYSMNPVSVIPSNVDGYLVLIIMFEGVWMLGSKIADMSDETVRLMEEEKRKSEIRQQEILESYIGNLEQMVDEMRAFQHDYKNILSTMAGFIRENQMEELRDFFYTNIKLPAGDKNEQREAWKYLKNIYPMELKGFLYEKLLSILTRNLRIQVHISENLNVTYSAMEDLIRIVGIYIDNAVEEAEQLEDGEVDITIVETSKGVLFCVENNFAVRPDIAKMVQKGYSTKGEGRGFGLYWAEKILERHADMMHELHITEEKILQQIEIIK